MKWIAEQTEKLTELAFAGESNKDIATAPGIPITDVYAKRSQLGITIDKIKVRKTATVNPDFKGAFSKLETTSANAAIQVGIESFDNDGELCIVLARSGDTALIVMPNLKTNNYVVPLMHMNGAFDWRQGDYFDNLRDAWEYFSGKRC